MNKNNSQMLSNAIGKFLQMTDFVNKNDLQKDLFLQAGEKCGKEKFAVANDLQKELFTQTRKERK